MIFFTKKNIFFLSLFHIISFYSCDTINSDENISGYIQINKITVENEPKSSNLTDVWINLNDNLFGAYELPAKSPVIPAGRHNVIVKAGIKINGIATNHSFYPFFSSYQTDTVIQPETTTKLNPTIKYRNNINIFWSKKIYRYG